jgi:lipoprotein-releasing system ATP-binding protein
MTDPNFRASVIEATGLAKRYESGAATTDVLRDLFVTVHEGETVAVVGASGSGKSTLLHLLGGLDKPTAGRITLMRSILSDIGETERCQLRNETLGFVYQFHHLLGEYTALDNVAVALRIRRTPQGEARARAKHLLEAVGLCARLHHLPAELSGGERQRVAIARALVTEPRCVLADEPTGNLDNENSDVVFNLLLEQVRVRRAALVLVTHDRELAARCDRQLLLRFGRLEPLVGAE